MLKTIFISALLILGSAAVSGQTSPDRGLKVVPEADGLRVSCASEGKWLPIFTIDCDSARLLSAGEVVKVDYGMISGKRSRCSNEYVTLRYSIAGGKELTLRLYNDGVAWKSEKVSRVDFSTAIHDWLQPWTDCYEQFFPVDSDVAAGARIAYPALFEYAGGVFALLTESGIGAECAGTSMYVDGVRGVFELRPDGAEDPGWQTAIIGSLADVVESTLVSDNSEPTRPGDWSWVRPGVASWIYWAYNHGSNNYDIICKYVDMAETLSLPYTLIDAEWDEMKEGKSVEDAIAYAHSKGVRPMIWYNSSVGWVNGAPGPKFRLNTPEGHEKEFAWCEKLGVAGVKIDFFSGDTNLNIKYMAELLEAAARHKLLVNFHGATLPRGWQRTYPNLITTEAVYGAEWYNNVPTFTPKAARHNATLPFTRNVVGSMDYTPCAFSDSQHPHITSHAHELALTVLYESGIQHIADRPESILAQPEEVRGFFGTLPTAWDDTKLLAGYPGEYAVIARRKGGEWYIGGINGTDETKEISLDFSRLQLPGDAKITLFADNAAPGEEKWAISTPESLPESLVLQPRGGFVITVR